MGLYESAQPFGEFAQGTANPSTADAVPLPLTREAWVLPYKLGRITADSPTFVGLW